MNKKQIIIKVEEILHKKYNAGGINSELVEDCINSTLDAINYSQYCETLKDKHSQTFDKFMISICKNRGIILINNYTKEIVGFDTLIKKWKATNT